MQALDVKLEGRTKWMVDRTNGITANQKKSFGVECFCLNSLNDKLYYGLLLWKVVLQEMTLNKVTYNLHLILLERGYICRLTVYLVSEEPHDI